MVRPFQSNPLPWLALPFFLLYLLAAFSSTAHAQALASVNKTTVLEGETIVLRLRTRADVITLDTGPLLADFRILRQAQMSSSTIFNNTRNTFIEWELELAPRRTGQLVIPALALGNENTRPIPVQILPMTNAQRRGLAQQVRIDVSIEDDVLYVGETTTVTLTLLYTVNVNGTFADIRPENAEWEPIGERQNGIRRLDDGNDYRYTAFTYLYTPTQPGDLVLPEIEFNGQIRQSSWAAAQVISGLRSSPIAITVRDIPAEFPAGARWLPARDVSLTEEWSDTAPTGAVGDQLVRTTRLSASGPAAHRLPELQLNGNPSLTGVRAYPEAPVLDESVTASMTRQSSRTERQAYLFTQNGTATLPAVQVPWWDVTRDELRWATLPARTLTISGAPASSLPNALPPLQESQNLPVPNDPMLRMETRQFNWAYGLFLLGSALLGLIIWRGLNRPAPHVQQKKKTRTNKRQSPQPASAGLLSSAQQHAAAKNWPLLLHTLNALFIDSGWPDGHKVARYWGVPERADELANAYRSTQALLYGAQNNTADDANRLSTDWQALLAGWPKSPKKQKATTSFRPRLYPS